MFAVAISAEEVRIRVLVPRCWHPDDGIAAASDICRSCSGALLAIGDGDVLNSAFTQSCSNQEGYQRCTDHGNASTRHRKDVTVQQ